MQPMEIAGPAQTPRWAKAPAKSAPNADCAAAAVRVAAHSVPAANEASGAGRPKVRTSWDGWEHCKRRDDQLRSAVESWTLWPVFELMVILTFVVPPFLIFGSRAINPESTFYIGTRAVSFWIIEFSMWGHMGYLVVRLYISSEFRRFNTVLLLGLTCLRLILTARAYARQDGARGKTAGEYATKGQGKFLDITAVTWTMGIEVTYTVIFVLMILRIWLGWRKMVEISRRLVSQKRRRFIDSKVGVDLDLTYISPAIIAMGWPTEGVAERNFRNPMTQVQRFFAKRHKGHYKVYNLCSERRYAKCFENECHDIRFPDHNVCPLELIGKLCADMEEFLALQGSKRVVAVHCKAGKGRTGMIASCLLLHLRRCLRASDALAWFGRRRTYNGKGVTIPSQIRYVHHYEAVVRERGPRPKRWLRLLKVSVVPAMEEEVKLQVVHPDAGVLFDSETSELGPPVLQGDFKILAFSGQEKLFQAWLHTAYDAMELADPQDVQVHHCPAGHRMKSIRAYSTKACRRCGEAVEKEDKVFECRQCDPIVWHCHGCAHAVTSNRLGATARVILACRKAAERARRRVSYSSRSSRSSSSWGEKRSNSSRATSDSQVVEKTSLAAQAQRSEEENVAARISKRPQVGQTREDCVEKTYGQGREPTVRTRGLSVCCPNGHPIAAARIQGAWECAGCGKRSWEGCPEKDEPEVLSHRCKKCDFNICPQCFLEPTIWQSAYGVDGETVVWCDDENGQESELFTKILTPPMLDGPHKIRAKTLSDKASSAPKHLSKAAQIVSTLQEVRLFFVETTEDSALQEQKDRAATTAVNKRALKRNQSVWGYVSGFAPTRPKLDTRGDGDAWEALPSDGSQQQQQQQHLSKSKSKKGLVEGRTRAVTAGSAQTNFEGPSQDYDDLADDTDSEENTGVLWRGYLLRQKWRCGRTTLRMAELHSSGKLHIAGDSNFDSLIVNITGKRGHFYEQPPPAVRRAAAAASASSAGSAAKGAAAAEAQAAAEEGQPAAATRVWRVRNCMTQYLEKLQAPEAAEEARWDEAFHDVCRHPLPEGSPLSFRVGATGGAEFWGYFQILTADVDPNKLTTVIWHQWRTRLLSLRDAQIWVYSNKEREDVVFCDLLQALRWGHVLQPLKTRLSAERCEKLVVFQVPAVPAVEAGAVERAIRRHTLACDPVCFEAFRLQAERCHEELL